jgi:hypothetical protein
MRQWLKRTAGILALSLMAMGGTLPRAINGEVSLATAHIVSTLQKKTGGFTYSLSRGSLAGQPGYAVAVFPDRSLILKGIPSERQVARYIESNADILRLPQFVLGGWYDSAVGKTYLDITAVVRTREVAVALGHDYNQKAVLDLRTLDEVKTGGTGENIDAKLLPPSGERVKKTLQRIQEERLERRRRAAENMDAFAAAHMRVP